MLNNAIVQATGFFFWTAAARLYSTEAVGFASAAIAAMLLLAMLSAVGLDYSKHKAMSYKRMKEEEEARKKLLQYRLEKHHATREQELEQEPGIRKVHEPSVIVKE